MSFARQLHVEVAIELDAHRSAGLDRRQSHQRSERVALGFLAAEAAAHAGRLDHDLMAGQMQHLGHDGLNFRGMLRGRIDQHRAVFTRLGPRRLRLEIKMLLAAKLKLAFKFRRRRRQCGRNIAPRQRMGLGVVAALGDGRRQPDHGR